MNGGIDAVVVLGKRLKKDCSIDSMLQARLDKAAEVFYSSGRPYLIVSGKRPLHEPQYKITEAHAMEKYLLAKGVEKNRIIREESLTEDNDHRTVKQDPGR